MGSKFNKPIGTLKQTSGLNFFIGNYYSKIEIEDEIISSLPQFVQIFERSNRISLGLIFSEE